MRQLLTYVFYKKQLLQGVNIRYNVLNVAFYTLSCFLEINNGQMESLDASDVKLFAVKMNGSQWDANSR